MKLGLLGYPINHSLSPTLYKRFLSDELESYELFSFENTQDVPPLSYFMENLDGLNITSPYKKHFLHEVEIHSDLVKSINAINTIAFINSRAIATNTDVLAVEEILRKYAGQYSALQILLLGDGVMAKMTEQVAKSMKIPVTILSRRCHPDFHHLDLTRYHQDKVQTIIINACSRAYIFQGKVTGKEVFWDYNYSFLPHQNTLPSLVKSYQDGQELLELQAKAAIKFWKEVNPKLK